MILLLDWSTYRIQTIMMIQLLTLVKDNGKRVAVGSRYDKAANYFMWWWEPSLLFFEWLSDCNSDDGDEDDKLSLIVGKVRTNGSLIPFIVESFDISEDSDKNVIHKKNFNWMILCYRNMIILLTRPIKKYLTLTPLPA
jgi:hypothetical protein